MTKLTADSEPSKFTYRIGRGEQGVLTFEPYKSELLPLWRFRTVQIAKKSSQDLWARFEAYEADDDFVGMDMARKFIQMGMTRSKRYANHAGGKKYSSPKQTHQETNTPKELPKSTTHTDHLSKLEASEIFKAVWQRCKEHEGYQRMKAEFLKEQKRWEKEGKKR